MTKLKIKRSSGLGFIIEDDKESSIFHISLTKGAFFLSLGKTGACLNVLERLERLEGIALIVSKLPFGSSSALPWCRESFPELDAVMREWETIEQEKRKEKE